MAAERGMRVKRVAEGVREELALLIADEVRDPGAAGTVVTRVDMTGDLKSARVYIRLLEGGDDIARRNGAVEALGRAGGMLRREVTQRLGLRYAPVLRFVYDEGLDRTMRVEELLAEIEAEKKSNRPR
jgi:ribosome-binding factor A